MSNISYSNLNTNPRDELKNRLDDFSTFKWRDLDMWEEYGMFIISSRGDLKFYNGAPFSNSYQNTVFNTGSVLSGVTLNTYTISFKVAVYWFTEEEYRRLMYFLDPYVIDNLVFSFDLDYRYLVKLSGRPEDSPRYMLGYDENGNKRWYTEFTLKFDLQGEPCAIGTNFFRANSGGSFVGYNENKNVIHSDLEVPLSLYFSIPFSLSESQYRELIPQDFKTLTIEASLKNKDDMHNLALLFRLSLNNLYYLINDNDNEREEISTIDLIYDSETGLIYISEDNSEKLLTLLSSPSSGKLIVSSLDTFKYKLPGSFNLPKNSDAINYSNYILEVKYYYEDKDGVSHKDFYVNENFAIVWPKTTLI